MLCAYLLCAFPSFARTIYSRCFNSLRVLALNSCGIKSWASIQLLEQHLPAVEELYLANNSLADLPRENAEREYMDATGAEATPEVLGKDHFIWFCKNPSFLT
jgi:hypothetical protein